MPRRVAVLVLLTAALASTLHGAGPQFWRLEGARAFLDGEIEGLSLDSEGRLRLGTAPRALFDPEVPNAWCVARDPRGTLYVGTGNDGRVVRFDGTKGTVLFDADELEVHAVAVGPDGRLYAATSPDGAVYAITPEGQAARFFDPEERYIWALAFDPKGALYVATGDVTGRVHRVTPDGKSEVALTVTDTHVLSLALDARGRVYAGTAPEGIVYRIDAPGKGFVLLDSSYREIKALDVAPDGSLYAAAIDGRTTDAARPAPPAGAAPPAASTGVVVAEVTVSESYAVPAPAPAAATTTGAGGAEAVPGPPKGALLRFRPSGEIDTLWSSPDDVPYAIVRSGADVLVGTGNKGKVYRVGADSRWALLATLPAEQVTALAPAPGGGAFAVTSNPARLLALDGTAASEGTFVSRVKDTDTVSGWGRVSWEGTAPRGTEVRIQTRSGNTANPDATWSDWSAPATQSAGEPIRSERARFLQLRVTLAGKAGAGPTVEAVTAAYLQRNLPPVVKAVTVHPPGEAFQKPITATGEPEILGLDTDPLDDRAAAQRPPAGSPPAITFSRKLFQRGIRTFSWQAEDPNGDPLLFDVEYRAMGDERWRPLRAGLTEPVFAWDTATVPNGRYVLRVVASDAPGNPPAFALTGTKDCPSFEVDNAPPAIVATLDPRSPARIRATVRDDASPVRKLEISTDAGRWVEIHPTDGIADSLEETYDIPLPPAAGGGPRVVVLRATDLLGNVATARVDAP